MENIKSSKMDKLIMKAAKGDDNIHFLYAEGEKVVTCVGGALIRPSIALVCHNNSEFQYCFGKIEGSDIFLSSGDEEDQNLRIVFDTNDTEDVACYCKLNDYEVRYNSEYDDTVDGLVIVYLENETFSQLFLYDHSLGYKFVSSFAVKPVMKLQIRAIAMSYIQNLYPEIKQLLCDLK